MQFAGGFLNILGSERNSTHTRLKLAQLTASAARGARRLQVRSAAPMAGCAVAARAALGPVHGKLPLKGSYTDCPSHATPRRSAAPKASLRANGCACGCSSPSGPPLAASCWARRRRLWQAAAAGCCSAARPARLRALQATCRSQRLQRQHGSALPQRQATIMMATRAAAWRPITARWRRLLAARWMRTCMEKMQWTVAQVRPGRWRLPALHGCAALLVRAAVAAALQFDHAALPPPCCLPAVPFPLERSRFASR